MRPIFSNPGIDLGSRGFSLVELMIAMTLGLLVVLGVISIFVSTQQTYRANSALSDVQEGSRVAFEMLARDIRSAGLAGCISTPGNRVANVITGTPWYANWNDPIIGYDDASADPALTGVSPAPVANTSSLHILSTGATSATVSWTPGKSSSDIKINEATTDLSDGDIVMICDYDHAAIVQISYNPANANLVHDKGGNLSPGNCSKGLGYPTDCSSANGNSYNFSPNAQIAKLTAHVWYIGVNPTGTKSLYRFNLSNSATATQEMVRNVNNMQINYLLPPASSFANATNINACTVTPPATDCWSNVSAAQLHLWLQSGFKFAGTNVKPLARDFISTTTIRNRVQ
jgi:type IV pilus assembly protein PilW